MTSDDPRTSNTLPNANGSITDQNEENITELQEDWGEEYNGVVMFLCGLHLAEYVEMFVNQGINLDIFLNLNEDDLCHIGMTNQKHRDALLQGISQLKQNKTKMASQVELEGLSTVEVNTILTNTVKHLTVIHASLAHMRLNLRNPSVHNSLITMTMTSAALLQRLASEAQIQAQLVSNQVNALLAKKPDTGNKTAKTQWKFTLSLVSSVGVVCALLLYVKKVR